MNIKWFIPAILWLITSTILLSLPGNDLPHADMFNIPYFDKYVHFTMFLLLTFLFSIPLTISNLPGETIKGWFLKIAVYVVVYGILMELVQKYLSTGRSCDLVDILFDTLGSIGGLITINTYYGKKIGPDGNRGRNQN